MANYEMNTITATSCDKVKQHSERFYFMAVQPLGVDVASGIFTPEDKVGIWTDTEQQANDIRDKLLEIIKRDGSVVVSGRQKVKDNNPAPLPSL